MNSDLTLLVSYVCVNFDLHKVSLTIPDGMNDKKWGNWRNFKGNDVHNLYVNSFPLYIKNHINRIIDVEKIFATHKVDYDNDNIRSLQELLDMDGAYNKKEKTVSIKRDSKNELWARRSNGDNWVQIY